MPSDQPSFFTMDDGEPAEEPANETEFWDLDEFEFVVYRSLAPFNHPSAAFTPTLGLLFDARDSGVIPDLDANDVPPPRQYKWYDGTEQSSPAPLLGTLIQMERTNVRLKAGAKNIEKALHEALKNLGAVSLYNPQKLKFKASVQSANGFVLFCASVFNVEGVHIVEIQRRSGSSVDFCSVWRAFLADSNIKELLQTQPQEPAHAPGQPMQVELDLQETEYLAPLHEMLKSEFEDVQCEGLRALGLISKTTGNAMLLLRSDAMTDVVKLLDSDNIKCRMAATRIVANVAKADASAKDAVLAQSIRPIIRALGLEVKEMVEVVELHRQSCIALTHLASAFAQEIFEQDGTSALSPHQQSGSVVLAREAQKAMAMINGQ